MTLPKLLAVDDRPQNLYSLRKLLQPLPVEVIATPSPIEALSLALDHDFCVAILDVQMPEMDGYELAALLRGQETTAHLPLIFVSAIYSDEYHHRLGYEAGAVDFISKPFSADILISKVAVFMDLYAQRQELNHLVAELNDANRRLHDLNADKNRLIGIVAHDLRNPLGTIRGLGEILLAEEIALPPHDRQTIVQDIFGQAGYMLTLVNDLLDISLIESGALTLSTEIIDLSEFLTSLVGHHMRLAYSTKRSSVVLGETAPQRIKCDPIRLRQVVDNLVTNAVKFSPPGSRTVVDVNEIGQALRVAVKDEGPGIPEGEQAQLFEYFCRASTVPTSNEKSTGLGLAISARIIKAHGGEIGVTSRPGSGATFWFTLPRLPVQVATT